MTSTSRALRRMLTEAPTLRQGLAVTVTLAAIGTAVQLVVPIVVQQIIDHEILDPNGVDVSGTLRRGAVALVAIVIAVFLRRTALVRLAMRAAAGLSELRVRAFAHIHRLGILHVASERRGTLVSRVTSDIAAIQDFVDWGGIGMLVGSAQVVLTVTAMLIFDWQLALLVVGGVTAYAILLVWFQRILQRLHDQVRRRVGDTLGAVGEAIAGLPVVRAHAAERSTLANVEGAVEREFATEVRTFSWGAGLFSSAEMFAGAITAAVIAAGVMLGADRDMSAGTLLAMLFLVALLVEPVQTLVETMEQAQSAASGVRRIVEVLDTPPTIVNPTDPTPIPPAPLDLTMTDVRFAYEPGQDVLSGVSVRIDGGSTVAVVGATGSGKSTFVKLLARLVEPSEGTITVGGVPLSEIDVSELRRRMIYVPQEGFLFDASIADNVRYGRPGVDDEAVWQAFEDLGLEDWVRTFPDQLATGVGERGSKLSAGERQLVALVRAWISDPDVLVMDEATSAVDPALEVRLRRAMERLVAGRTSVTVAHRLSTSETSDVVLVFDEGRLVEVGPHLGLVAAGNTYTRLYQDWVAGTSA